MGKTAFLFPGQGAQYVGMGKDFYETYDVARRVFEIAKEATGLDVAELCFTENDKFEDNEFYKHIQDILKMEGHKEVTVKIFHNLTKYTERLEQMNALEEDEAKTQAIIETLKSVML